MNLNDLLRYLTNELELVSHGPSPFEIRRVLEFSAARTNNIIPGTLYLIGTEQDLADAKSYILNEYHAAFVISSTLLYKQERRWWTQASSPVLRTRDACIRLDLSASIQRILDMAETSPISGDGIARARQDLVDDLLFNRYQDPSVLLVRSRALGLEIEYTRIVMLVALENFNRFYVQNEARGEMYFQQLKGNMLFIVRRLVGQADPASSVTPHGDGVVALLSNVEEASNVAERIAVALRKELPFVPIVVATGGAKTRFTDLHESYQEAMLAFQLRRRLRLKSRHVAFPNVISYALLEKISQIPEILSLLRAEIRPLVEMDKVQHSRLVETIAAYFDAGLSLKRASVALKIHPKTLRYRLDKVEEVLGYGVLDGEKKLLYYLAAKLHLWMNS